MEKLSPWDLKQEQENTLTAPHRRYGFFAQALFLFMTVAYGKKRSIRKFKVLEVVARVPYQAWENVAYIAITHTYAQPDFARRIFEFVRESRAQQDNEQWHLLILEEMVHARGIHENFFLYRIIPQILAFFYYHLSWILYVLEPAWSYALNADLEDHAEHEYMEFAQEHPKMEKELFESEFEKDYGHFNSLADLFRQIGYDERIHKLESESHIEHARFS